MTPLIPVVGDVWEQIVHSPSFSSSLSRSNDEIVFVGNWFLKDRSEIRNEVFPNKQREKERLSSEAVEWVSLDHLKKIRSES
jgi:hypothetical protein